MKTGNSQRMQRRCTNLMKNSANTCSKHHCQLKLFNSQKSGSEFIARKMHKKYHNFIIVFHPRPRPGHRTQKNSKSYRILLLPLLAGFSSLVLGSAINLRKIFNAFRLEVQLRENEITMGKAFVSYFPSFAALPRLRNCFKRSASSSCVPFLLCSACRQARKAKKAKELNQCLQWRIEFPSGSSNASVACTAGASCEKQRGINKFSLLTLANFVGFSCWSYAAAPSTNTTTSVAGNEVGFVYFLICFAL